MIVSKSSLLAVNVTAKDKGIPALDNVRVEADGTVVGAASNVVVAVSPVDPKVAAQVPIEDSGPCAATLSADTVRKALKLLGDKMFGGLLEHCDIKTAGDDVTFTFTDGKRRHTMDGRVYTQPYIPWRTIIMRAMHSRRAGTRVVLNRARLHLLLETLEKICPDSSGQSPVYMELTEQGDIVCRARNAVNGQRVVATMKNYTMKGGAWLEEGAWERSLAAHNDNRLAGEAPSTGKRIARRLRGEPC